jgi:hypothetical protein
MSVRNISGQQVLDAWLATHQYRVDERMLQLCLNAPSVLYEFLFVKFDLITRANIEKTILIYRRDAGEIGYFTCAERLLRVDSVINNSSGFLRFMNLSESEYITNKLNGYPELIIKFQSGTLTLADILLLAPGVIFDRMSNY